MGQGRLIVSLGMALLLSACGQDKEGSGWASFPVPIYADSTITSSPEKMADLTDAMDYWSARAGKALFDFKGEWTYGSPFTGNPESPDTLNNVIFFQNPWPYSAKTVGMTTVRSSSAGIESAMIMMNPMTDFCSGDCEFQTGHSQRKTFAHELGHFIGLGHHESPDNIMYPDTTEGASLTAKDIDDAALRAMTGG